MDQGRFFAADKRPGAESDFDIEGKIGSEDVLAQQAVLAGGGHGLFQPLDGQRIFGPNIDDALAGSDRIPADDHPFNHGMGIAFDRAAVHERARIAFVGVADHILFRSRRFGRKFPFDARGKARAAAAAKPGFFDLSITCCGVISVSTLASASYPRRDR